MNCIECFSHDGNPAQPADFIVNGQSMCQKHVHLAVRERGQAPLLYTWHGSPDAGPTLQAADPLRSFT